MLTVTSKDVDILKRFSLPETFAKAAVVLTDVYKDSPASRANLSPGDMVVRIGCDNCSAHDIYKAVRKGSKFTIEFYRQTTLYGADVTPILLVSN